MAFPSKIIIIKRDVIESLSHFFSKSISAVLSWSTSLSQTLQLKIAFVAIWYLSIMGHLTYYAELFNIYNGRIQHGRTYTFQKKKWDFRCWGMWNRRRRIRERLPPVVFWWWSLEGIWAILPDEVCLTLARCLDYTISAATVLTHICWIILNCNITLYNCWCLFLKTLFIWFNIVIYFLV